MARSRPRNLGRRDLLSGAVAYASPAQWTVLVLTLTLVGALLVVSGRRQPAGSGELQVSPGFGQIERAAGNIHRLSLCASVEGQSLPGGHTMGSIQAMKFTLWKASRT